MTTTRWFSRLAAVGSAAALLALLNACGTSRDRPDKAARSALWIAAGTPLDFGQLAQLESVGVVELMIESATLAPSGGRVTLTSDPAVRLPRRTGVTLVVTGALPAGAYDADALAKTLSGDLERLVSQARERNLEALGIHLDLTTDGQLDLYATLMHGLREGLPKDLYLSLSLERPWLEEDGVEDLVDAVDYVVAWFYGRRPPAPDSPAAWDLKKVEVALMKLEKLGCKYQLGAVTLGRALKLDGSGRLLEETTRLSLGQIARSNRFEVVPGSILEGVDHQAYSFRASAPGRLGSLELARGQILKMVGLAGFHVEELERYLEALDLPRRRGTVYYRLAADNERLSLSIPQLLAALDPGRSSGAEPRVSLVDLGGGGGRRRVKVVLENASEDPTDIVFVGGNFVEIRLEGGAIGSVNPGQFHRWDTLAPGPDGELTRAFRNPPILRLFTPMLDGHERIESGPIELSVRGGAVKVGGEFVVPGGTTVQITEVSPAPPQ